MQLIILYYLFCIKWMSIITFALKYNVITFLCVYNRDAIVQYVCSVLTRKIINHYCQLITRKGYEPQVRFHLLTPYTNSTIFHCVIFHPFIPHYTSQTVSSKLFLVNLFVSSKHWDININRFWSNSTVKINSPRDSFQKLKQFFCWDQIWLRPEPGHGRAIGAIEL